MDKETFHLKCNIIGKCLQESYFLKNSSSEYGRMHNVVKLLDIKNYAYDFNLCIPLGICACKYACCFRVIDD